METSHTYISACGIWGVRVGVQVSRKELHTHIHLNQARLEFLFYIYIYIYKLNSNGKILSIVTSLKPMQFPN